MDNLQVAMLPYLYFKDFKQSSGVIHQAGIAKAMQEAGLDVTVLLPDPADGWKYDADAMFPGVNHKVVAMPKNQMLYAGMGGDKLLRLLTPTKSDLPFEMLLNCNPPTGLAYERLLGEVRFTKARPGQVLMYDNVTVVEEFPPRRHVSKDYVPYLAALEAANTAMLPTVVTTASEVIAVRNNQRTFLAPAMRRDAIYIPKPMEGFTPELRKLPAEGEPFRVFMARSLGPSMEDTCGLGVKVFESLFRAVTVLRATGKNIVITAWTNSPGTPWLEKWQAELGDALELHRGETRQQLREGLRQAHFAVDFRAYDGLYMAAIEQSLSGAVTLKYRTKWIEGEAEGGMHLSTLDTEMVATALSGMMGNYEEWAKSCYEQALLNKSKHDPKTIGSDWSELFHDQMPAFKPSPSLAAVFHKWAGAGPLYMSFDEACKDVAKLTDKGSFGQTTKLWFLKMFRHAGCRIERLEVNGPLFVEYPHV